MITNDRMLEMTLSLLKQESDRDRQKKIGASDFSDPCAYHLAKKLLGVPEVPFKYWLGAKIGTATHAFLEDAITKSDLPELSSAAVEQKIFLGTLEGYGDIHSKPDLVLVEDRHVVDWKTSTRDKSRKYQRVLFEGNQDAGVIYSLQRYYTQAQIYAWGLSRAGTPIDTCSLVFINRDGTTDTDIWSYTFDYEPEHAETAWKRLETIWENLGINPDPEQFDREGECFKCKVTDPA